MKYDSAKLESLLRKPTEKMATGGMPAIDLKDTEMNALLNYLQSLK